MNYVPLDPIEYCLFIWTHPDNSILEEVPIPAFDLSSDIPKLKSTSSSPYSRFYYAINSEELRRYYIKKMENYLEFVNIDYESLENGLDCLFFSIQEKGLRWFEDLVIEYMTQLKARVLNKEIKSGTVRNFHKLIKLYCDMNRINISWKIIARGMFPAKHAAQDRAPTFKEIYNLPE